MNIYQPWPEDMAEEAVRMYKEGISSVIIGKKIGKSPNAVRAWFHKRGLGRDSNEVLIKGKQYWTKEQKETSLRLRDEGIKIEEIATHVGKTYAAVKRFFYYQGIQKSNIRGLNLQLYSRPEIPQSVLDDRDRRNAEAMTLHMLLLGDPVPCQSALANTAARNYQK